MAPFPHIHTLTIPTPLPVVLADGGPICRPSALAPTRHPRTPSVVPADAGTHLSPFHLRFPSLRHSRVEPALVKTGAGTHLPPPHMSFRAQRSGAEESCCPSPRCPRGPILVPHPTSRRGVPRGRPSLTFTPSPSPHPYPLSSRMRRPIPVPTRRACPREDGGRNPSSPPTQPHVGASLVAPFPDIHTLTIPSPSSLSSRMRGPILVPHPISRRGSPRGPPSLTFTPAPSPHPYPLSSRMRGPIPVPTRRACPREDWAGTHLSSFRPRLPPFFPRRAGPREDGGGNPCPPAAPRSTPPFRWPALAFLVAYSSHPPKDRYNTYSQTK